MRARGAVGAALAVVAAAVLGSCARASLDDLATSRDEVRAAAVEDVPAFAEAIGGEVRWARGEYEQYGLKNDIAFAYEAEALVDGSGADLADVADAFAQLGWAVEDADRSPVTATRDGLRASASVRPDVDEVLLSVDGPRLRLAGGARPAVEDRGQQELGLPYPVFVPYEPPGATPTPTAEG